MADLLVDGHGLVDKLQRLVRLTTCQEELGQGAKAKGITGMIRAVELLPSVQADAQDMLRLVQLAETGEHLAQVHQVGKSVALRRGIRGMDAGGRPAGDGGPTQVAQARQDACFIEQGASIKRTVRTGLGGSLYH